MINWETSCKGSYESAFYIRRRDHEDYLENLCECPMFSNSGFLDIRNAKVASPNVLRYIAKCVETFCDSNR